MIFNSLNTIIDDILLEYRNSNIGESEQLSRLQVEQWIHNYRAILIKQDIDKGRDVNPAYIQTISIPVTGANGKYTATNELPKLIDFHFRTGIVSIRDNSGRLIQLGSRLKSELQPDRQYAINDPIAYISNNIIHINNSSTGITSIEVDAILEDPTTISNNYDPNSSYPISANMIPTIKDLIFTKELYIMPQEIVDTTNDSDDNTVNKVSARSLRKAK